MTLRARWPDGRTSTAFSPAAPPSHVPRHGRELGAAAGLRRRPRRPRSALSALAPVAAEQVLVRVPAGPARTVYVQFNEVGNKPDQTDRSQPSPRASSPSCTPTRWTVWSWTCVSTAAATASSTARPGARPHPGAESAAWAGTPLHAHRPRHLLRGAVPGQRPRALHRGDLRRRADRRKASISYGDSQRIRLPNSGITVRVSTL